MQKSEIKAIFGPVWDGAGTRGFFGEGYPHHRWFPGCSFEGSTFVAKTSTYPSNKGNMDLTDAHRPIELFPRCVYVDFRRGIALNAVALAGPGFEKLLGSEHWLNILEPFMLSYMPVGLEALHLEQTRAFVSSLKQELKYFITRHLAIQFNITCPNVKANIAALMEKARAHLDILGELGIPIFVKVNVLVSPEAAHGIAMHPACTGLVMSNSIPFGELSDRIDWDELFPNGSPLHARGFEQAGGLSGAILLPIVARWLVEFRKLDPVTYVNAGGGVLHKRDVGILHDAGADSIFVSSVAMLRPWRVQGIIDHAHEVFR